MARKVDKLEDLPLHLRASPTTVGEVIRPIVCEASGAANMVQPVCEAYTDYT